MNAMILRSQTQDLSFHFFWSVLLSKLQTRDNTMQCRKQEKSEKGNRQGRNYHCFGCSLWRTDRTDGIGDAWLASCSRQMTHVWSSRTLSSFHTDHHLFILWSTGALSQKKFWHSTSCTVGQKKPWKITKCELRKFPVSFCENWCDEAEGIPSRWTTLCMQNKRGLRD